MEQRSDEWLAKRAGCFTASRAGDLMARTRSGPAASRGNLITLLAVERLTGKCVETYQNGAMLRGIELEPEARAAYSFETGVAVEEAAFLDHPEMPRVGCSPDGLIGSCGMVELKCPTSMTKHMEALTSAGHVKEYHWQLQHQLFVSGREWVDMVSYHPDFPEGLQLAIRRVFPNEEDQQCLAVEIHKADAEVEALVARLRELRGPS